MRRILLSCLLSAVGYANEISVGSLQSGTPTGPAPLHDLGLFGQGQIIAILDTGLDFDSCYFAEPDGRLPPINTGVPGGELQSDNVDLSRRKVVAYDFLFSCDQFPGVAGCDNPQSTRAWDNQGHGTHAAGAAAGDRDTILVHDFGDALAPGAQLIIQDTGYTGGDNCSQLAALGCPINRLDDALLQAWRQGARIHSNSWGDRQGTPPSMAAPTGNYSESARTVDQFVFEHPDSVVLFNTGNFSGPASGTVSSPGLAKNTIQVGGTRTVTENIDEILSPFTGQGPTRDGRVKPDLVGPAYVVAGDTDFTVTTGNCNTSRQPGTSWASPTLAGAVALVRQYFVEGFYPSGMRTAVDSRIPSAALLKAALIASARQVPFTSSSVAEPIPSYQQGFGRPVLDDALYFSGDRSRLRVQERGITQGSTFVETLAVRFGTRLKVVLVWTDPPGTAAGPTDSTRQLVNDLDLNVRDPVGSLRFGNERLHPGQPDRLNNVEMVEFSAPASGSYQISVRAERLSAGASQSFALVIVGDFEAPAPRRRAVRR